MFKRIKCNSEFNDGIAHPDHEERNTRVSEYLRKYGQGKLEVLPTDNRPQVEDPRTVDEMLAGDNNEISMADDELDIITRLQDASDHFQEVFAEIELTKQQKEKFDNAVKVLNDPNASTEKKVDAYRILDELESKGKVTRARD